MSGPLQRFDLLTTRTDTTPQRTALRSAATGDSYTYRQLDEAVTETARALDARLGDSSEPTRLGIALSPSPEFVVGFYAAVRLGWQVVPLNTALATGELSAQTDRVEPDICLCERETEDLTADVIETATTPLLSVDEPTVEGTEPLFGESASFDPAPPEFDDTCLILFTSGTTGEPKAVRLTGGNLLASAFASALRLGVTPADRWLCCLPMYHMGGLAPAIRSVLYGTELLVQPEFDASRTAQVLESHGVTGVSLVPTQLTRLLDEDVDPGRLRTVLLGGAPAPGRLLDRARDAGLPVYPTYGLTETASQVTTALPAETAEYPNTVGQPLFGTTVRIVEEGQLLDPGERGEIVVDGPTVSPGYLDESNTAAAFSVWGLHTGDIGYRDEDGRLWVLGRRDETIITGGELVSPTDVAESLQDAPGVTYAAVLGLDDPEWGERVGAVVATGEEAVDAASVREEVIEYCRKTLAVYKVPKTIAVAEAIPRTHSGTVDRDRLRELLRSKGRDVSGTDFS
ncbi:MAG: class I adenylate-forming enzyme family protein [Halovenus sp.]